MEKEKFSVAEIRSEVKYGSMVFKHRSMLLWLCDKVEELETEMMKQSREIDEEDL